MIFPLPFFGRLDYVVSTQETTVVTRGAQTEGKKSPIELLNAVEKDRLCWRFWLQFFTQSSQYEKNQSISNDMCSSIADKY